MDRATPLIAQLRRIPMRRVLGVSDLFAVGYADLGASIFYALGITALFALGATPIALGIAAFVFLCTAFTYAEMSSTFPESGGSASYARHAFNDLISFIAGWGLLLDYIVTIAISAFTVGPYLGYFWAPLKQTSVLIPFTIALIALLYVLNVVGIKGSTRASLALTVLSLATQAIIVVIGCIFVLNIPFVIEHLKINVKHTSWSPTWAQFFKGTVMAMVAYTGIESIAQLAAESKVPHRTMPRSILLTLGTLLIMYLGISFVALSVMPPHVLGTTYVDDPLSGIVAAFPFGHQVLLPLVGIAAAIILLASANAGLIGASRLSFNMGEYYQLPRFFYRLHARFRTPYVALTFFSVLASVIVIASQGVMEFLGDLYNFGAQIAYCSAHLALLALRIKRPHLKRPFESPMNLRIAGRRLPLLALIGVLATFTVWVLVVVTKPAGRYVGSAWMVCGVLMYLYYRRKKHIAAVSQLAIEEVVVPGYEPLLLKQVLVVLRGPLRADAIQMACEIAAKHKAKLTVAAIVEVPFALPVDVGLRTKVGGAQEALKHCEAIAREYHLDPESKMVRARSASDAILDLCREGAFDLVVLSSATKRLSSQMERVLQRAPCRVLCLY